MAVQFAVVSVWKFPRERFSAHPAETTLSVEYIWPVASMAETPLVPEFVTLRTADPEVEAMERLPVIESPALFTGVYPRPVVISADAKAFQAGVELVMVKNCLVADVLGANFVKLEAPLAYMISPVA